MKKSPSFPRSLAAAFLLLYAFCALVPAAMYRAVHAQGMGSSPQRAGQEWEEADSGPSSALESGASSAEENPSSIPGFLDGITPGSGSGQAVFTLYDTAAGQSLTVPEREFVKAAVACEMDLSAPEEALKAQALATYTYYCRQRQDGQQIACDTENWLVYVPQEAMEARWGEDFAQYNALLDKIADEVSGQLLTWQGEPILAAYFAISPGATEAAENVWSPDAGEEHPYLQAAASPGDMFSDGYRSTAEFTAEEVRELLASAGLPEPEGEPESWLAGLEYTPSQMVKSALLGGEKVSGTRLREIFGLRSASFQCTVEEGTFRFQVQGWGHGVGMSQAGAVFLAKQGADYREILAHYYPGTQIAAG